MNTAYYLKPKFDLKIVLIIIFSLVIIWKIYKSKIEKFERIIFTSSVLFPTVYSYLFTLFYPTIIDYQGGSKAARFVNENFEGKGSLIDNKHHHFGFEFYSNHSLIRVDTLKINDEKGRVFYLDKKELDLFDRENINNKSEKCQTLKLVKSLRNSFLTKPKIIL